MISEKKKQAVRASALFCCRCAERTMRKILFSWSGFNVYSYPAMLYLGMVAGVFAGAHVAQLSGLSPRGGQRASDCTVADRGSSLFCIRSLGRLPPRPASHLATLGRRDGDVWRNHSDGAAVDPAAPRDASAIRRILGCSDLHNTAGDGLHQSRMSPQRLLLGPSDQRLVRFES